MRPGRKPARGRAGEVFLPAVRDVLRENARLRRENFELRVRLDRASEAAGERSSAARDGLVRPG